jgi:hypothetical protein
MAQSGRRTPGGSQGGKFEAWQNAALLFSISECLFTLHQQADGI